MTPEYFSSGLVRFIDIFSRANIIIDEGLPVIDKGLPVNASCTHHYDDSD
jgi:hypothetical protein